jgi:outer membrane protein OmpA-like peptidoglycan-associated protein
VKKLNTRLLFAAFMLLGMITPALSQKHFNDKKTLHLAKEYLRIEEYEEAKTLFQELVEKHPENSNFKYYLGVCYFKLGNADKALKYFKESTPDTSKTQTDFNYFLGKSFLMAHHFDDAITYYEKYLDMIRKNPQGKYQHTQKEIEQEIERCRIGMELMKKPNEVEIINLSDKVNSKYHDYMPVISLDETEMMFTSRRPGTTGGGKDPEDEIFYEDIYVTIKADSGWTEPRNMVKVNTNGHDATVCLSGDGKKLFIYRSSPSLAGGPAGNIFMSELKDQIWSIPVKVNGINSDYWEPSGSISANGDKFFFSSNRPRPNEPHRKDRDLYMVKKMENGEWGNPVRLSNVINTTFEEDAPFIHPDGKTLYFSSNGNKSLGGFDIFKSVYNEDTDTWSEPENIGFPFNTAGDDIYIVWSADGRRAYFSSQRDDSYGGKDIYMATSLKAKHSMALMIGKVFDADTKKPLGAEVVVIDNSNGQVVGVFKADSYSGKFSIALPSGKNYGISVSKEGYLFHSENIIMPHMSEFAEYRKDIYMHPFKTGAVEILKNIFFDTDKAEIRQESKPELDKLYNLLKKDQSLHVQISGHTDDRASHEYNLVLSEARAVAVVQYLVDKGIDRKKIFAKGYGEIQPVASNETEEGRQINRRIEFMILDRDDDAHSKYINNSDTTLLRPGDERYNKLLEDFKSVYTKQQAEKPPVAGEYLYYKVHFAFNQTDGITDYSTNILKSMLGYLDHYSKVKIKIYAHADFFGDEALNLRLATERAQTVYNFLIKNGLDKSRVILCTKEEILATIKKDQEEGNTKSRRVEFLVVSDK